jgi:hypothetical protein
MARFGVDACLRVGLWRRMRCVMRTDGSRKATAALAYRQNDCIGNETL